jgi:hypothetical protein
MIFCLDIGEHLIPQKSHTHLVFKVGDEMIIARCMNCYAIINTIVYLTIGI